MGSILSAREARQAAAAENDAAAAKAARDDMCRAASALRLWCGGMGMPKGKGWSFSRRGIEIIGLLILAIWKILHTRTLLSSRADNIEPKKGRLGLQKWLSRFEKT